MLAQLTGDDLFAQILMLRTSDSRTILLVEGPADSSALDPHIDKISARTLPGHSKSVVERAIELIDKCGIERVLAILDKDWVGMLLPKSESGNVVYTDMYDLEATILLGGDVLDRLLSSLSDRDRMASHLERLGASAHQLIVRIAGVIGLGRFVSSRDRLEVRFQRFPVHSCTDANSGTVDIATMATVAIGKSKRPTCSEIELTQAVRDALGEQSDLEQFCSGHDMAALISHLIKTEWGGARVSRDVVEKAARAAFDRGNLERSRMYTQVDDWARAGSTAVWAAR